MKNELFNVLDAYPNNFMKTGILHSETIKISLYYSGINHTREWTEPIYIYGFHRSPFQKKQQGVLKEQAVTSQTKKVSAMTTANWSNL